MNDKEGSAPALATPSTLVDLLEYQTGSVVSRTLIKKATGTLTLFAFDEGEGLSEHSTPHDAVVQVLDGTVEVTIGGAPHTVAAGEGRQRVPSPGLRARLSRRVSEVAQILDELPLGEERRTTGSTALNSSRL